MISIVAMLLLFFIGFAEFLTQKILVKEVEFLISFDRSAKTQIPEQQKNAF